MPELPEVEVTRKRLARSIVGSTVSQVEFNANSVHRGVDRRALTGLVSRGIQSVSRRGKYLLLNVDCDVTLIVHFGMSGRFVSRSILHHHDVFTLCCAGGHLLTYSDFRRFGRVWVHHGPLAEEPTISRLGPEPLSNRFTEATLAPSSRRPIKTALLDQRVVAGLGNIYTCESLYWSGLRPQRPVSSLGSDEVRSLVTAIKRVLRAAISVGGATLSDYRETEGAAGNYDQQFAVFGREGLSCPHCDCGSGIQTVRINGRSSYFCGKLQK